MKVDDSVGWPWIVLLILLAACLAHGLWVVRGLGPYAAILDTYRDAGFVQGFLDGNLAGDPSIEGAKRYYPPLFHALAACFALVTHARPLDLLVHAAPWINLLVPVTFFLMVRRLVGAPAAAIAAILFVCFDGLLLPPWMAASYTPWHSVPAITQALFFLSVWLISTRVQHGRFVDVLTIGSAIGLVFLAHTVPALILAAITATAAVTTRGLNARTVAWVVGVGVVVSLWATPFMLPLVTSYHMKVVNAAGSFIDPMFNPTRIPTRVITSILPGAAALAWLGWNFWKAGRPAAPVGAEVRAAEMSPATVAILAAWIALPLLFISRHFGCGGGDSSAVCTAFVVPVHHWLFYLQSALACVFGYAVVLVVSRAPGRSIVARKPTLALGFALALGCALLMFRPIDKQMRERALDMSNRIDLQLYEWLLASTPPNALFITDVSTNAVHDTAAMATLAAGRKSVALPFTFSNPYVEWEAREHREQAYLAAARSGMDKQTLCRAVREAGRGSAVYVALAMEPQATDPPADRLRPVFRTRQNNVYRVPPSVCN